MEKFTKEDLLNKLKDFLSQSDFLNESILEYAKDLEQEKLEKLLIIVFQAILTEKNLWEKWKEEVANIITEINKEKISLLKKAEKDLLKDAEKLDKEKESPEDLLVNI